jgi:hypothetical protein
MGVTLVTDGRVKFWCAGSKICPAYASRHLVFPYGTRQVQWRYVTRKLLCLFRSFSADYRPARETR